MRNLFEVINNILAVVPEDQQDLRSRLASVQHSVAYSPPELMADLWNDTHAVLFSGYPVCINDWTTWMWEASRIFSGVIYHVIDPQPVVKRIDAGWDISGIPCFMGTAEHHIGQDERFKPPLEICGGSYNNIDESFVERQDGKWTWIIKLME